MADPITIRIEGGTRVQRLNLMKRLVEKLSGESVVSNGETELKLLDPVELHSNMGPWR